MTQVSGGREPVPVSVSAFLRLGLALTLTRTGRLGSRGSGLHGPCRPALGSGPGLSLDRAALSRPSLLLAPSGHGLRLPSVFMLHPLAPASSDSARARDRKSTRLNSSH